MSDEPEQLSSAERRVRTLLAELGEGGAPDGERLTRAVARTARWQRPVRRVLRVLGLSAGALAAGAGETYRAYRRR